jgi:hypothetical protein
MRNFTQVKNGSISMKKDMLINVLLRILATFAASGLGVIGAGTIAGVPVLKAVFMAGIAGVAVVIEGLSRAFLEDGKLSSSEINDVFNKVDKKAPAKASDVR